MAVKSPAQNSKTKQAAEIEKHDKAKPVQKLQAIRIRIARI